MSNGKGNAKREGVMDAMVRTLTVAGISDRTLVAEFVNGEAVVYCDDVAELLSRLQVPHRRAA